jgi:hypothetical protein
MTKGPTAPCLAVVTRLQMGMQERATAPAVHPKAEIAAVGAEDEAIVHPEMAPQPAPLRVRQGVVTRHGPEDLREELEQAPLRLRLLALAPVVAQGLLVLLEI